MTAPSPFSAVTPKLQLAWDSTSLRTGMACPRRYQYAILEQWRGTGVDVEFGGMFAAALEVGWKARARGATRDQAQLVSLKYALEISGHYIGGIPEEGDMGQWVPWGGLYVSQWKCTGKDENGEKVPYKNAKGNAAKCPRSHKAAWFDPPAPSTCACGAACETVTRWLPAHSSKDRYGLVRAVVWYWEEMPVDNADGLHVYVFPNGTPAVELSFAMPLGIEYRKAVGGKLSAEPYILCGHLDTIKELGDERFPADNKTTAKWPGASYFATYSPDIQMDTYDFATSVLYPDLECTAPLIEAAQVQAGGCEFVAQPLPERTEAMREEYFRDLELFLRQMEAYAEEEYWPMNRAACFLCEFKKVCSVDPALREHFLKANFTKREWNPLKVR